MVNYFQTSRVIKVGDRIRYGGRPGQIVFVVENRAFSPSHLKKEWCDIENGIGVRTDNGQLFLLPNPDEDLELFA